MKHLVSAILIALTLAACGDEETTGPGQTSPQVATQLAFTVQPTEAEAGASLTPTVKVEIQDALGNTVTDVTDAVTVAIGTNPFGGTLSGTATVNAVGGIASFSDLSIDRPGGGYTLVARSGTLTGATSSAFDIRLIFSAVTTGAGHTCGVTTQDRVYCWGVNGLTGSPWGNLGTLSTSMTCFSFDCSTVPIPVEGDLTLSSVSAGRVHTCGLTRGGAAYCWGLNDNGQLGDGTTDTGAMPRAVSGGLTFQSLSTGGRFSGHTCGVATGGEAYCWGDNYTGQLGNGMIGRSLTPVLVSAPASGAVTWVSVSAGRDHTCGVATDRDAYCWGLNNHGQLGDVTTNTRLTPVLVHDGFKWLVLSAGYLFTCGVRIDDTAACWGRNDVGQLGKGSASQFDRDNVPVPVATQLLFHSVTAGGFGACGLTTDNAGYCWGRSDFGQLGTGSTTTGETCTLLPGGPVDCSSTPRPVTGGYDFQVVEAGGDHACGLTTEPLLVCWGRGVTGQLGDGKGGTDAASSATPVRVIQ